MLKGEVDGDEGGGAPVGKYLSTDRWNPSAMRMRVSSLPSGATPTGCLIDCIAWLKMSKLYASPGWSSEP